MEFLQANLLALLGALGIGGLLAKLLDFFLSRRKNKVELDSLIIEEMSKEITRLRNLIEALTEDVDHLKTEVRKLEEEVDSGRSLIRRRDDFYYAAVKLVEDEPDSTLRPKLRQLLEDMKALVLRRN